MRLRSIFVMINSFFSLARSVGVCCPDSVADRVGPSVVSLPQQGDDDKLPVWGTNTINGKDVNGDELVVRPEERGCGVSTKAATKITGGRPADPNEWPWMAALRRRGPPNAYCGGNSPFSANNLELIQPVSRFQAF